MGAVLPARSSTRRLSVNLMESEALVKSSIRGDSSGADVITPDLGENGRSQWLADNVTRYSRADLKKGHGPVLPRRGFILSVGSGKKEGSRAWKREHHEGRVMRTNTNGK